MITEDYVSFETAKLLKSKGFDSNAGDTSKFYMPSGNKYWNYNHYHDFDKADRIECPTLQMAMKWLRKEHHLNIIVDCYADRVDARIMTIEDLPACKCRGISGEKYEEAAEAAIKYCLENLI
jgi:hypothetical protein